MISHIIDTTNLVNDKPIYYYTNEVGLGSKNFSNAGQIILINCNYSTIKGVNTSKTTIGISLNYCYNITVAESITSNNLYGIYIKNGKNNTFTMNFIKNNNEKGVYIFDGVHNLFYKNYFIKNTLHVLAEGITNNFWNNSEIGNYWDNYTGIDSNDDGIGDTPHSFNGGIDYLPIVDNDPPSIKINLPKMNEIFGDIAPNFNVEINDFLLDSMWYSLNHGKNITFISNDTIEQSEWNYLPDENITLTFYANDTSGNVAFSEVVIQKDTTVPNIVIINPVMNEEFGETAPTFRITIEELNLDKVWYTIDGISDKIFINDTIGTIDQSIWDSIPSGQVTIKFYANDSAGNAMFDEVTIIKKVSSENPPAIPGFNLLALLGITLTTMLIIGQRKKIFRIN